MTSLSTPLDAFYSDNFAPNWLPSCSQAVLHEYREAVDWFVLWSKHATHVADISDDKLKEFAAWLVSTSRTGRVQARNHAARLRQIRRFAKTSQGAMSKDMRIVDFLKD